MSYIKYEHFHPRTRGFENDSKIKSSTGHDNALLLVEVESLNRVIRKTDLITHEQFILNGIVRVTYAEQISLVHGLPFELNRSGSLVMNGQHRDRDLI
jgi:hypothetical protein